MEPEEINPKSLLHPVKTSEKQNDLCVRLDEWHSLDGLDMTPSNMFRGALYAIRVECAHNPDKISQAANSLREILYPFKSAKKLVQGQHAKAFDSYGSVTVDASFHNQQIEPLYKELNDITHHGVDPKTPNFDFSSYTVEKFMQVIDKFEQVMDKALTRQLDVHGEIDEILKSVPSV